MELSDIRVVKSLLARYEIPLSKGLGQNFLINPTVCPRIAEMGGARPEVGVLEIGPGIGVLTAELAERAGKVVAVEVDDRLLPVLEETVGGYPNVRVVHGDALRIDLRELVAREFAGMPVVVCANLPYYITSPILMALLEARLPLDSVTVMVQKEAAERLCAPLGTREVGAITVAVRYFAEPELLFSVSPGSFLPPPKVESSVIRLSIRKQTPPVDDEGMFFRVVRAAFSQRRKMLSNTLSAGFAIEKAEALRVLAAAGVSSTARAEELRMEDFTALANAMAAR